MARRPRYYEDMSRMFARQRAVYLDSLSGSGSSWYSNDSRLAQQLYNQKKSRNWMDQNEMSTSETSEKTVTSSKKRKSLLGIVKSFAEKTSMQGVPHINTSKHWFQKGAWTVLLLGSLVAMTLHLKLLCDTYYAWPKHSRVALGFSSLEFPAITICNVNPIRRSQLHLASPALRNIVDITEPDNIVKKMTERQIAEQEESVSTGQTNSRKRREVTSTAKPRNNNVQRVIEWIFGSRRKNNQTPDSGEEIDDDESIDDPTTIVTTTNKPESSPTSRTTSTTTAATIKDGGKLTDNTVKNKKHDAYTEILDIPTVTVSTTTQEQQKPTTKAKPTTTTKTADEAEENIEKADTTEKTKGTPESIQFQKVQAKQEFKLLNDIDLQFENTRYLALLELEEETNSGPALALPQRSMASKILDEFHYLFSQEQRSTRVRMGHQLEDMLVDCSFAGRICHPQNFSIRATTGFGNCFTLQHTGLIAQSSGSQEGMQLIVYLEEDEYMRGLTSGNGGQVVIHRRDSCPFPNNDGIAIASGSESNIGLRLVNIERLGTPYGKCEEGEAFKEKYGYKYTRQSCQVFCLQNLISGKCSCYDEDEEELNIIAKIQEKYPPCRNTTELKCMLRVKRDYETGKESCECHNPCSETRYQHTISSRQWPSDEYTKILVTALCEKRSAEDCQRLLDMDPRKLAHNFMKINIFYEDLNYENITEQEDYETSQFISDVGGTVGLWVGLSMLSIFEVVELLLQILKFFTVSVWCRQQIPKESKSKRSLEQRHSSSRDRYRT